MTERIVKVNGGIAAGLISQEADKWRASLLVGPEVFSSQEAARTWIIRQAAYHGLEEERIDLQVETG